MIKIDKGKEPLAWSAKKGTPGFTNYESIPELRTALLIEQGYICAYCMRRIPCQDDKVDATSKIEHILSQDERPELQLDYGNIAICCPGNLNNEEHCDKLKKGKSVTFSLYTSALQDSIKYYSKDGKIESNRVDWNNQMNDLLNLNHSFIKMNRRDKLVGVIKAITSKKFDKAFIRKIFNQYSERDKFGKMEEYCGIIIWYLQKALKRP